MPNIGVPELILVLVLALLILGPKRLPSAARSLGRGMHEFKEAVTGRDDGPSLPVAQESDAELVTLPARPRESAEA